MTLDPRIDTLVDVYIAWRHESVAVRRTYRWWRRAPVADRPVAFAAYAAALELEERAAARFAEAVEIVGRLRLHKPRERR